jgi:alpha-L-fucosidase 2
MRFKNTKNVYLAKPIDRWEYALPIGNGLLGALVWGCGNKLKFSLDRGDLWDLREPEVYKDSDFNYTALRKFVAYGNFERVNELFDKPYIECPYPTKIPAGRLVMDLGEGADAETFDLDFESASVQIKLKNGQNVKSFCSAVSNVCFAVVEGANSSMRIEPIDFGGKPDSQEIVLGNSLDVRKLGLPNPQTGISGNVQWSLQKIADDFQFVIAVGCLINVEQNFSEYCWTICSSADGDTPLELAIENVSNYLEIGYESNFKAHVQWWSQFWKQSDVNIPEKRLEQHYNFARYLYGSGSRPGNPPLALQGLWTADNGLLPCWKGDYHNDLNLQMTYWAYMTANHLEQGQAIVDFLWSLMPNAREYAQNFLGTDGACFPGVMSLTAQPLGGWPPYAYSVTNSVWLAQHFYWHWRYSMDEDFLHDKAYPFCKEHSLMLEGLFVTNSSGKLQLPLSSSPELSDNTPEAWLKDNSNYDLAIIHWLYGALCEMAEALDMTNDKIHFEKMPGKIEPLKISSNQYNRQTVRYTHQPGTGPLEIVDGVELSESHRHFAHTMPIFPFSMINIENGDYDRNVIEQTLMQIDQMGMKNWVGFSFVWMACIAARCGKPERAMMMLDIYLRSFIAPNGFHVNWDYKESGITRCSNQVVTLETNFGASEALNEMLLQSWGGKVRVFPAVPDDWAEASFNNLRAEGAFLVSAVRKDYRTVSVDITALRDSVLTLKDPFDGCPCEWDGAKPINQTENACLIFELKANQIVKMVRK